VVEHKERAAGIVAAEEIEHGGQRFGGVAFLQVQDALVELAHAEGRQLTGGRTGGVVVISKGAVAPKRKDG